MDLVGRSSTPYELERSFDKLMGDLGDMIWDIPGVKELQPAVRLWKEIRRDFPIAVRETNALERMQITKEVKNKLRELEQLLAGQMRLFAKDLSSRVVAKFLGAALDPEIKNIFDNLNQIADDLEGSIEKDIPRALGIKPVQPKNEAPRKRAPKTYAQAKGEILNLLREKGWKISSPDLKVPHATAPGNEFRLWFKPQAIYFSSGLTMNDFRDARSAWAPDYRHMSAEEIVKHLERQFAKYL